MRVYTRVHTHVRVHMSSQIIAGMLNVAIHFIAAWTPLWAVRYLHTIIVVETISVIVPPSFIEI